MNWKLEITDGKNGLTWVTLIYVPLDKYIINTAMDYASKLFKDVAKLSFKATSENGEERKFSLISF